MSLTKLFSLATIFKIARPPHPSLIGFSSQLFPRDSTICLTYRNQRPLRQAHGLSFHNTWALNRHGIETLWLWTSKGTTWCGLCSSVTVTSTELLLALSCKKVLVEVPNGTEIHQVQQTAGRVTHSQAQKPEHGRHQRGSILNTTTVHPWEFP